ncbi:MAG: MFS transporter [Bacilli bacterium]|jgi:MFS family permease|nr:MFS transporter [Bacilli bacterium]
MKQETAEQVQKRHDREQKELVRRKKDLAKPLPKLYLYYLFMVVSLAYITDEVASNITYQFQSNIINDFFVTNMSMKYGSGLSLYQMISALASLPLLLVILYKPLADRLGWKPFLVFNTFMMAIDLFIIYLSKDIVVFMIGSTLITFFVTHDVHVIYILETAPEKKRAIIYSLSKGIAVLGTLMVPLFRQLLMADDSSKWHLVFLVPAIFGFAVSLLALLTARKSTTSLHHRIAYLEKSDDQRQKEAVLDKEKNSQGGIKAGLVFSFKHRQLRNLMIVCFFFLIPSVATSTYQTVMVKSALMSEEQITQALYLYPVGNAIFTVLMGFISDRWGRKSSALTMTAVAIVSYALFFTGTMVSFPPMLMGFCAGAFVGAYWSAGDTIDSIMIGESAPTNLRSSCATVEAMIFFVGGLIGQGIVMVCQIFVPEKYLGLLYLLLVMPAMITALILLWKNVGETKGIDLDHVTGEEWDRSKPK